MICSQIHSWLSLSPDSIVVLHARTCTGTERQLVHLVAACHIIFSFGCDSLQLAMEMLPPLRPGGAPPKAGDSSASLASMGGGGGGRGVQLR